MSALLLVDSKVVVELDTSGGNPAPKILPIENWSPIFFPTRNQNKIQTIDQTTKDKKNNLGFGKKDSNIRFYSKFNF